MRSIKNAYNGRRTSPHGFGKLKYHVQITGIRDGRFNLSLNAVLGQDNVEDFRELSEIHNDGWGVAQLSDPAEAPHVRDGGAPTPETAPESTSRPSRPVMTARFETLADEPSRGAIWHLRLASSNLPLIMENQHPFYANGLSFIHNGDISGRPMAATSSPTAHTRSKTYSVLLSTGGRSDSAIFFAVILEYIGFGFSLDEAVAQAVRELRQAYPKSSYNCMIQSEDQLIALCAAGREKTSPRIVESTMSTAVASRPPTTV